MYRPTTPLQRIDQQPTSFPSQLYEPLRKSLLRTNLSQSNISSRSNLSNSRINDMSSSRVSRRMRSLSPQEAEHIKNNTFIPVTKRLVATKNLYLVKDKKFQAIDVEEKVHKAIPAIRFNSINRFNANKVEEIVYQPADQVDQGQGVYGRNQQFQPMLNTFGQRVRQPEKPFSPYSGNIYTNRGNNFVNGNLSNGVSQVREYSPRDSTNFGVNARPMTSTFGSRENHLIQSPQKVYQSHFFINNSQPSNNNYPAPMVHSPQFPSNNNNRTSFQHSNQTPSTLPLITSTAIPANPTTPQANLHTSQFSPKVRQLPTQNTLSFVGSPFGSRTSFQPQLQKNHSQLNKSYDFSKMTLDSSSTSEYQQKKKKEEWKYNLFSIFDEPANTKCSKTGCFKNQIVASRPNLYEWQQ